MILDVLIGQIGFKSNVKWMSFLWIKFHVRFPPSVLSSVNIRCHQLERAALPAQAVRNSSPLHRHPAALLTNSLIAAVRLGRGKSWSSSRKPMSWKVVYQQTSILKFVVNGDYPDWPYLSWAQTWGRPGPNGRGQEAALSSKRRTGQGDRKQGGKGSLSFNNLPGVAGERGLGIGQGVPLKGSHHTQPATEEATECV